MRVAGLLIIAACCALALARSAPALAAPARVQPVVDTYFGETITDPYRWMEAGGPELTAWLHDQDAITRHDLKALPGYAALAGDVAAAVDAEVRVPSARRVGDRIYYEKQGPGEAQASLYVRPLAGGEARRLVDPVALGGATTAIGRYAPSPDNRYLAYTLAGGGSEEAVLHFLDLRTGRTLHEAIDRARFARVTWSPDGAFAFYTRLQPNPASPAERFADETVYRHRPGDDPAHDVAVFTAAGVGSALGRAGIIGVYVPPGSAFAFALVNSGVSIESEWYVAPAAELASTPHWTRIAALADKINQAPVVHGREAWLITFKDAPRRKVIRIDLAAPDVAAAPVVVPEQAGVLQGIAEARDGVYLTYSDGAAYHLRHATWAGALTDIATPYDGSIYELTSDPRRDGAVLSLESWVRPIDYFEASPSGLRALALSPPFPIDLSGIVTETIWATAKDGVRIPVTVVHRRDLARDGAATALVDAYGAYGTSSDAYFDAELIPFLQRGGVYAEVHVRGGGEFGEAWHLAGKGATKPNTWRDFIAAVETLEAAGFTSPGKVAGMGVSGGGIMIGRTVTERPDLLAAAVMWSPVTNALRFETTEGGPANTAELGSTATPAGYAALRAMDTYSHIAAGTAYPAILITGGANDHRVPVWMSAETAARFQAASGGGKPVYLRIDFEGGHHNFGAAKADRVALMTDTLAFVLQATGAPDFQPSSPATSAAR
jgi:prolyl oligopeptidase